MPPAALENSAEKQGLTASSGSAPASPKKATRPAASSSGSSVPRPDWREDHANPLSYILLWWLNPLMHLGKQRALEDVDLPEVRDDMRGSSEHDTFNSMWQEEVAVHKVNAKDDTEWFSKYNAKSRPSEETIQQRIEHLKERKEPSIVRAINRAYGFRFWGASVGKLGADACQFVLPILLQMLLDYLGESQSSTNPPDSSKGYLLGMAMFLVAFGSILFTNESQRTSNITGMRVRSALITAIYQKSLRLSPGARANMNTGQIVSMMSIDCSKIDLMFQFFHMGWTAIFSLAAAIALLVRALGVATAVAVGVVILFMPIQTRVMRRIGVARFAAAKTTDQRMKVMTEILQGIRVIKLYAWERPFIKRLFGIRHAEMDKIGVGVYARSINNVLNTWSPSLMMFVTYLTYSYTKDIHNASEVFSSLVLLNLLRWPLILLPFALSSTADAAVGFHRVQKFLLADELTYSPTLVEESKHAIRIEKGEFSWDAVLSDKKKEEKEQKSSRVEAIEKVKSLSKVSGKKDEKSNAKGGKELASPSSSAKQKEVELIEMKSASNVNTASSSTALLNGKSNGYHANGNGHVSSDEDTIRLKGELNVGALESKLIPSAVRNINVEINKGKLIAVVGSVGSGKSSFLSGILGEMKRVSGEVFICGKVAYIAQQAWIQNSSLKENILFGEEYDAEKYERAIQVCALKHDISVLPAGDHTEIGERGINLSGGQKQRVSIARAVYHDADIYLFDDPLSAVDAHVSKHIFFNCVSGALNGKTRVLVTHQLQYMPYVDEIYFMDSGEIVERGSYNQLMAQKGKFSALMEAYGGRHKDEDDEDKDLQKQDEQKTQVVQKTFDTNEKKLTQANKEKAQLMSGEERTKGGLKTETILFYIEQCGGYRALFFLLFSYSIMIATRFLTDNWLKEWVGKGYSLSDSAFIGVYGMFNGAQLLFAIIAMLFVANRSMYSATRLHDIAFKNVMRAPMSFFDTTPIGRVMNRFSRDQDVVDNLLLNESIRMALFMFMNVLGMLIMIAVYNYWFAIAIPFIIYVYDILQKYYRASSRELKRLDAIARSPLFAHFSETLTGLSTIRAYQRQNMFIESNYSRMDANNRPYFVLQCSQRWLAERLELIGAVIILLTAMLGVAARNSLNPASLGLSLSYAVMMTQILAWLVRQLVESENNMNAVERAKFYSDAIAQEKAAETDEDALVEKKAAKAGKQWPEKGEIVFKDFSMRYRDGLPLVLNGIQVKIMGGERVGVVGRTGAGKSSMMLALFRLVEPAAGNIFIDGVDVHKLGLEFLRSRLAIIPQDAVLYSGTVRSNLDPFNLYEDHKLWSVLEKVYMKDAVSKLPEKLEAPVAENGDNFSAGQRAQISLARAILRDTKILVMDEATASIDLETDSLIQASIRKEFQCTILTIAHRLNTIVDYDRVMVLSNGNIVEYDRPALLLRNPKTILSQLVDETGEANAALLRQMAEQTLSRVEGAPTSTVFHPSHPPSGANTARSTDDAYSEVSESRVVFHTGGQFE